MDANKKAFVSPKTIRIDINILGTRKIQDEESANPTNESREIVVQEGDTLSSIADTVFGDENRWPEIWQTFKHNSKSNDPNLIYKGEKIQKPVPYK